MIKINFAHTMIRVKNLESSINFYKNILGMNLNAQKDFPTGEFTLVFLGFGDIQNSPQIELTYNWNVKDYQMGDAFGHFAFHVENIYEYVEYLRSKNVTILREPGPMKHGGSTIAFVADPDGYKIELIEKKIS